MKLYQVQATVVHHTTDSVCMSCDVSKQVPTFLLDGHTLGIVDLQHAEQIAREIVCPIADDLQYEAVTVHVTVVRIY